MPGEGKVRPASHDVKLTSAEAGDILVTPHLDGLQIPLERVFAG